MKNRIGCFLAVVLAASMVLTCVVFAEAPAETEAARLERLGLFQGTGSGFELDRTLTRAEAATMLVRMAGEQPAGQAKGTFEDVPAEHWAASAIDYGVGHGYINGAGDGNFEPERDVTGVEFAKMLLGVLGYRDFTLEQAAEKSRELNLTVPEVNFTRRDVVILCSEALGTATAAGKPLRDVLIEKGAFTQEQLDKAYQAEQEQKPAGTAWKLMISSPTL